FNLFTQEIAYYVNEANHRIRTNSRIFVFNGFLKCFIGSIVRTVKLSETLGIPVLHVPNFIFIASKEILVIYLSSSSDALATFVSFISISLEDAEAILASAIFCLPLLAACTI